MTVEIEQRGTSPAGTSSGTAALLLLAMLHAAPADAFAATPRGSSTGTVQIRLSVAPRLELQAPAEADVREPAAYCLSGNIGRPALPVRLLWPAFEPPQAGANDDGRPQASPQHSELSWCEASAVAARRPATGLALISPE